MDSMLRLWAEAVGVAILGGAGFLLGRWFSRRRAPWWTLGYFLPLALVIAVGLARHFPVLEFVRPFSWLLAGRWEFAWGGLVGTMVLTTPLSRLPLRRDRIVVAVLMVVLVGGTSVWPLLAPAFNHRELAALRTRVDADGVCLQGTGYTCGPAAAVTALRRLGLPAEEGELALLAHTSAASGTQPDVFADILRQRYAAQGLSVEYRPFRDLEELRQAGLTLAVVKFALFIDHYVTVLEVTADSVVIGDPLSGRERLSREEFVRRWRFNGVVLRCGPDSTH